MFRAKPERNGFMCVALAFEPGLSPEEIVALLAMLGIVGYAGWLFLRWFLGGSPSPDPWGPQVAADLEDTEARPLCHRCLARQETPADFCRECGAPVGRYTNLMPFPYLFSVGHELRIGTSGQFKRSFLTVAGFPLLALAVEPLIGLIYCVVFAFRLSRPAPPVAAGGPPAEPPAIPGDQR